MKKKVLIEDTATIQDLSLKNAKVKIIEVEKQLEEINQAETAEAQEEETKVNYFEADADDIDSLEELVKIGKSDIKTDRKKDALYKAAIRSVSVVA
jgi:hypothetical protein